MIVRVLNTMPARRVAWRHSLARHYLACVKCCIDRTARISLHIVGTSDSRAVLVKFTFVIAVVVGAIYYKVVLCTRADSKLLESSSCRL